MNKSKIATEISGIIGLVEDGYLTTAQIERAQNYLDNLLPQSSSASSKLTVSMLSSFLRLRFDLGLIEMQIARFLEGDYIIDNNRVNLNNKAATSDTVISFGGLESDGWSISQVVRLALAEPNSPYNEIAEIVAKQLAMLIYAMEKITEYSAKPFRHLADNFRSYGIDPFHKIRLFEFAGNRNAIVANPVQGVGILFGAYKLHNGAGGAQARPDSVGFVEIASAQNTIPNRESGFNYIIARNVFNLGAVSSAVNPQANAANLICAFSNSLPDSGVLCISTSIQDAIPMFSKIALMRLTGFIKHEEACYCDDGATPSYILRRDFRLRGLKLIEKSELPTILEK